MHRIQEGKAGKIIRIISTTRFGEHQTVLTVSKSQLCIDLNCRESEFFALYYKKKSHVLVNFYQSNTFP